MLWIAQCFQALGRFSLRLQIGRELIAEMCTTVVGQSQLNQSIGPPIAYALQFREPDSIEHLSCFGRSLRLTFHIAMGKSPRNTLVLLFDDVKECRRTTARHIA